MPRGLTHQSALLVRPRVTECLVSAASYPMTAVIAPAGFGKTTAVNALLGQRPNSSVLISTPTDANIDKFIQSFALAFSPHFADMATPPSETNAGAQNSESNIDLYVAWAYAYLNNISFTIAIDDLQRADDDPSVGIFLTRLAELTKDNLTWVFSSRTYGHLPLHRWQAYGCADAVITADVLRMTAQEAAQLANTVRSPATSEQISEWVELTHGYPVPLTYAIRLSASRGTANDIMDGTRSITFRFLAEQLWESLSPEERELLELAAFLPPLHMHRYEEAGVSNATVKISRLCENIAFLTLNVAGMFSMHDLFRDFLRQQLSTSGPAQQRARLNSAAELLLTSSRFNDGFSLLIEFASPHDLANAVERFPFANCNMAVTRSIIDSTGEIKLEQLGLRILELNAEHWSWIGDANRALRYGQEILRRSDASSAHLMCAIRSIFRTINFQGPEAHKYWLSSFPPIFDRLGDDDRVQARAYQASLLSRYSETQDEARALARQVLNETSMLSSKAHIDALIVVGTAYFHLNDDYAALSVTRDAAQLADVSGDPRERARALNIYGMMLDRARDPEVESIFDPLRNLVERTGSWRYSHVSHWLPAQYYALQANLGAAGEALAWQSAAVASEEYEKERLSGARRHCINLSHLIREDYRAVISDVGTADLRKQVDIEYDLLSCAALAYAFLSNTSECEKTLVRLKQLRLSSPAVILNGAYESISSEIIALCIVGRWGQARQLNEQLRGRIPYQLRPLEAALALLCQGPPFLGVLAALEPCLNKPYIGLAALHIKRVVERELANHVKQPLTTAEMDVLRLIVVGKSNKQIASDRKRSEETVKRQVASLYRKLGVDNRTSAAAVARERGILN
jgi:DNA-binding CsgD family transcriptional regulator